MPSIYNRTLETSDTIGTGPYQLNGPPGAEWSSFSLVASNGEQIFYSVHQPATGFEIGIGTLNIGAGAGGTDTITRNRIIHSSNSNLSVSWPQGRKTIYCTIPADQIPKRFIISSVLSDPPGHPSDGQSHIIGKDSSGVWAGLEHMVSTYNQSLLLWATTTPNPGDWAYDLSKSDTYIYTGASQIVEGIYVDSYWKELTPVRIKWSFPHQIESEYFVSALDHGKWFHVSNDTASAYQIFLPGLTEDSGAPMGMEIVFEVDCTDPVEIISDDNILFLDNSSGSSITVYGGEKAVIHLVANNVLGTVGSWIQWR